LCFPSLFCFFWTATFFRSGVQGGPLPKPVAALVVFFKLDLLSIVFPSSEIQSLIFFFASRACRADFFSLVSPPEPSGNFDVWFPSAFFFLPHVGAGGVVFFMTRRATNNL